MVRVHQLYTITEEIVGNEATASLLAGVQHSELTCKVPLESMLRLAGDGPAGIAWWDSCADKCLLLGVAKHGSERYDAIRADPTLCFLDRCGPPGALPEAVVNAVSVEGKLFGILIFSSLRHPLQYYSNSEPSRYHSYFILPGLS